MAPEAATANLHKAAHYARTASGERTFIVLSGGAVELWPGREVEVDVDRFERQANAALKSADRSACIEAARAYEGALLPDERYEEWTLARRDYLHSLAIRLLFDIHFQVADAVTLAPVLQSACYEFAVSQ